MPAPSPSAPAADRAHMRQQAAAFVAALGALPAFSPERAQRLDSIAAIGAGAQASFAARNPAMPEVADARELAQWVADLMAEARALDPALVGQRQGWFGRPLSLGDYFARYHAAQGPIADCLTALSRHCDALLHRGIVIAGEQDALAGHIAALVLARDQAQHLATLLTQAGEAEAAHAAAARAADLAQIAALAQQQALALAAVKATDMELGRSIDEATRAVLIALASARAVAQALGQQLQVLDRMTMLDRASGNLIAGATPAQGDEEPLAALQEAFAGLYDALDGLDNARRALAATG